MNNRGANEKVESGVVRAPRGAALSCKGWEQEAALRMLMNYADPEVAERSEVWRDGDGLRATMAALRELEGDQTLLVRSGKPVEVLHAGAEAPRVVISTEGVSGSNDASAASWLGVGTQTGLPAAYEAFAAAGRKHFGGTLAGRLVGACGMGATGGPLPLAATLNGAAFLGIDADAEQIKRRVKSGYCEVMVNDLDEALRILKNSVRKREAASAGLIGNCADVIPELARRGIVPDLLVDCTSACGSLDGYMRGILELKRLGSLAFEFGGGLGERSPERGVRAASVIPDFSAEYICPLYSAGRAQLVWVALSGEPADIARADRLALELFSPDKAATRWLQLAGKQVQFQGLPARVCLVDQTLHASFGVALNGLVAQGTLKAPMVIGCEDFGGGTERPSAKATAPDALIAALGARARVASWVAIEEEDNRSAGGSRPSMRAVVADGTPQMVRKISGVLGSDLAAGVGQHSPAATHTQSRPGRHHIT